MNEPLELGVDLGDIRDVLSTDCDDAAFLACFSNQLRRVNHFAKLREHEIFTEMAMIYKRMRSVTNFLTKKIPEAKTEENSQVKREGYSYRPTDNELSSFLSQCEESLKELAEDVIFIDKYIRQSFSRLIKASVLFDDLRLLKEENKIGAGISQWCVAQLTKEPFANVDIDRLLICVSLSWEKFRLLKKVCIEGNASKEEASAWKPPESFVRNTTKYWVRPDKVVTAKIRMLRHVPSLIFGLTSQQLEFLIDPLNPENLHFQRNNPIELPVKEARMVSSVYLDSPDCHSYSRRIRRLEGAQLMRLRWYGENNGAPDIDIYVERKTHHEGWSGEKSAKERFSIPQKRVMDFLKGNLDIDQWAEYAREKLKATPKKVSNIKKLGTEINEYIKKYNLQPMTRTSYLRSAFQAADNNQVRFSLDTNLCMVNEFRPHVYMQAEVESTLKASRITEQDGSGKASNGSSTAMLNGNYAKAFNHASHQHQNETWCRVGDEILANDHVVRFPYAVLEVKLQVSEQPAWVSRMLYDSHSILVYKFSKYLHGTAFLHREKVMSHGVPHWIPEFEARGFVEGYSLPDSFSDGNSNVNTFTTNLNAQHTPKHFETRNMSLYHQGRTASANEFGFKNYSQNRSSKLSVHQGKDLALLSLYPGRRANRQSVRSTLVSERPVMFQGKTQENSIVDFELDTNVGTNVGANVGQDALKLSMRRDTFKSDALQRFRGKTKVKDESDLLKAIMQRAKIVQKLDPKSLFASERTFLHYSQKALIIFAIGFALKDAGNSLFTATLGISLILCSLIGLSLSYAVYDHRTDLIQNRTVKALTKSRFDSSFIALSACAIISLALIINLVFNVYLMLAPSAAMLSSNAVGPMV